MNKLYDTIAWFCKLEGKTVYGMCTDIGISKGALFNLNKSEDRTLSTKTLQKIADYLDLSVNDLLGTDPVKEEKNRADGLKAALFGTDDVSDDMFDEVKRYAEYLLCKSRGYF